jgi:hypothetical protein
MAAEIETWSVSERIDAYLATVAAAWAAVPADATEWDEWDWESRLVYRFGWTNPRDDWRSLEQWAAEGLLTPDQRRRFDEIATLIDAHSATLARLLDPESDRADSVPAPAKSAGS